MQNLQTYRQAGFVFAGLFLSFLAAAPAFGSPEANGYRSEKLKEAPPPEVSEKVRKLLEAHALRLRDPKGKPFIDIWLRKSVPTKKDENVLGIDFGSLPEGTLLGVMRFHGRADDFRGDRFRAGLYTFRYAVQPEDGDHQGVSEARDFILLCPAKLDVKPDPIPTDDVVKLSVKVSGRKHPSVLYLTRMFDKPEKLPRFFEQPDKEYWIFDCEIPGEGKGKKPVRLGLVLVGLAAEF